MRGLREPEDIRILNSGWICLRVGGLRSPERGFPAPLSGRKGKTGIAYLLAKLSYLTGQIIYCSLLT
jgi:hypothetical protein